MPHNAALVARLLQLGPLPDAGTPAADDFPLAEFAGLVQQLAAPLSREHATALLNLGPPPGTGCHGVEWELIHAVDLAPAEVLQAAVAEARDTEVTQTVAIRLANYFRTRNTKYLPSAPMPLTPPLPAELAPYAAAIEAHLHQPTAWFVPINQLATSPAQSKIGGYPYLPQGAPNPLLDDAGQHRYNLLVQVNLADLPAPRPLHFPSRGLLQFFARDFESVMDDDPIPVHCVYYPTLAAGTALVTDFAATPIAGLEGYDNVPAEGVAVAFKSLTINHVEPGDYYGDLGHLLAGVADTDEREQLQAALTDYLDLYNEALPDDDSGWDAQIKGQYPTGDYGQPVFQSTRDYYAFTIPDHQLGGLLSQFWQGDPRPPGAEDSSQPYYNQLLLAYDNRGNCTEYGVPFLGDDAKMLLYINRDELARGHFGDLLYSWMP